MKTLIILISLTLLCSCQPKMYILSGRSDIDPAITYNAAYVHKLFGMHACRIDECEDGRVKNPGNTVSKDSNWKLPSLPTTVAPVTPIP